MSSSSSSTSSSSSSSMSISSNEDRNVKRQKTTDSSSSSTVSTTEQVASSTFSSSSLMPPPTLERAPFHTYQPPVDEASIERFCEELIKGNEDYVRTFLSDHAGTIAVMLDERITVMSPEMNEIKTKIFDLIIYHGLDNLLQELLKFCTPAKIFDLMRKPYVVKDRSLKFIDVMRKPYFVQDGTLIFYGANCIHKLFRVPIFQSFQKCMTLLAKIGPDSARILLNERSDITGTPTTIQELNLSNERLNREVPASASQRRQETRVLLQNLAELISLKSLLEIEGAIKALEDCTQTLPEAECEDFWSKLLKDYPTDAQTVLYLMETELIIPNGKLNTALVDWLLKNQPGILFSWLGGPIRNPHILLLAKTELMKIFPRVLKLAPNHISSFCNILHQVKVNDIPLIETIFEDTSGDAHIVLLRQLSTWIPMTSFVTFLKTQKYKDGTLLSKTVEGLFQATPLLQDFARTFSQNPNQRMDVTLQRIFVKEPIRLALLVWSENYELVAAIMQRKDASGKHFFEAYDNNQIIAHIAELMEFNQRSYAFAHALIYANNNAFTQHAFKDKKIVDYMISALLQGEEEHLLHFLCHEALSPAFVIEALSERIILGSGVVHLSPKSLIALFLQQRVKYKGALIEVLLQRKELEIIKRLIKTIGDEPFGKMLTQRLPNGRFPFLMLMTASQQSRPAATMSPPEPKSFPAMPSLPSPRITSSSMAPPLPCGVTAFRRRKLPWTPPTISPPEPMRPSAMGIRELTSLGMRIPPETTTNLRPAPPQPATLSRTGFLTELLKLAPRAFFTAMQQSYSMLENGRCESRLGFTVVLQKLSTDAEQPFSKDNIESVEFLNQLKAKDLEVYGGPAVSSLLTMPELVGRGPNRDEVRNTSYDLISKNNNILMSWFITQLTDPGFLIMLSDLDQNGGNALSYAVEECNLVLSRDMLARFRTVNGLPDDNFPETLQQLIDFHTLTVNQVVDKCILELVSEPEKALHAVTLFCAIHIHMSPEKLLHFNHMIAVENDVDDGSINPHGLVIPFVSPFKVFADKVAALPNPEIAEPFYEELFAFYPQMFVSIDPSRLTTATFGAPFPKVQSYKDVVQVIEHKLRFYAFDKLWNVGSSNYTHVYRATLGEKYRLKFQRDLAPADPNARVLTNAADALRQYQFHYNVKELIRVIAALRCPIEKERMEKELSEMSSACDPRSRPDNDVISKYFKGGKIKALYVALLMMREGLLVPRETPISAVPGTFYQRICTKMQATWWVNGNAGSSSAAKK